MNVQEVEETIKADVGHQPCDIRRFADPQRLLKAFILTEFLGSALEMSRLKIRLPFQDGHVYEATALCNTPTWCSVRVSGMRTLL
jgi:hypothetical protein